MKDKYKIAFVTGSRADYGIVRKYISLLNNDENIDFSLLVTGALLSYEYGHQVDLIRDDGFRIDKEIDIDLNSVNNEKVIHSMSVALDQFGTYFESCKYDLLIILGDRYEMLSVAIAATMHRISILHIHGGEATYGNYDEFIRHSITKMSLYHFTATEEYRRRVIQMGEAPDRVFNLGALGAENCLIIDEENVTDEVRKFTPKKYFVILFHPETLSQIDPLVQVNELLNAIEQFEEEQFVFLGTNADTHSDIIRTAIKIYVTHSANAVYFENLHTDAYHYLVKNSICLVGNSSSGIIEAPSLGVFTINIGDRQKGRVRGASVIDVMCNSKDIITAMKQVRDNYKCFKLENPYFQHNAANRYYKSTLMILNRLQSKKDEPKKFFDCDKYFCCVD